MGITINGSSAAGNIDLGTNGTIADLAVGGIPDGTIDTDAIAANAVDGSKIAMGSDAAGDVLYYNGTDYIRLAKGTDGQVLTLASGVPTWANASGGIDGYDMWRLTANLTGNQLPITTSSLERVDDATSVKIGTGMSVSSGVFSFPNTGIWRVTWGASVESDVDTHQNVFTIEVTSNNSSYDTTARTRQGIYKMSTGTSYGSATTSCIVDVISTSDVKVRFEYIAGQGSEKLMGSSNENHTFFEFIRLGDT